jgi:imidazolonepropionase-like amidohydrolase
MRLPIRLSLLSLASALVPLAALSGFAFGGDPVVEAPPAGDPAVEAPAPAPAADVPAPEPPLAADAWQIRAKTVYLGDGNRIEDGVVVIENGKIRSVGRGVEIDPNAPLLEHDGVLTAGMVVSHSYFGVGGRNNDATRSMLPEARLADAWIPGELEFAKALADGITSIVLAPTGQNLAGGQTCVVKTDGKMLKREAHLALSFSKDALNQGGQTSFFFFNAEGEPGLAAVDDGLEETGGPENGGRVPTSYPGALAMLRAALAAPEGAFAAAKSGGLPVLIEAWDRNEVARAASFAQKQGLKGALRGAPLAGDLVELVRASGLGVILGPFGPGQSMRSLASAAALAEAGVPLGISLAGDPIGVGSARFTAAMAVAQGLDRVAAWKALTSDAARLANVAERVGKLERGLDADLVLWSGDPIDLTTRVEAVFIDGKRMNGGKQ